jgi:formylglycine-generating enzyme required for sulfatase activity
MLMKLSRSVFSASRFAGGFLIAASLAMTEAFLANGPLLAAPITIDWVTVGNPNNPAHWSGYGSVATEYRIAKYEVTIQQYTEFLNAADPHGSNPYGIYDSIMSNESWNRGISFSNAAPSGHKYGPIGTADRPIVFVNWFNAARFANWMHNGQGAGSTETGAYTLGGVTSGSAPAVNPGANIYIPTANQWFKAAYYSPVLNSGTGGYFYYATQSNTAPGNIVGNTPNQANYYVGSYPNGTFSVTQTGTYSNENLLTAVGSFTNSASYYGTFDQSGSVVEWNDGTGAAGLNRGLSGGGFSSIDVSRDSMWSNVPASGDGFMPFRMGFRLAAPVAVPEPSTYAMAFAGLACGGYSMWRRSRGARHFMRSVMGCPHGRLMITGPTFSSL